MVAKLKGIARGLGFAVLYVGIGAALIGMAIVLENWRMR
jgi:hypothetical protein